MNSHFTTLQFAIPDQGYYETQDGLSWGLNPAYRHEWNQGGSEIRVQISRRETPTLPTERRAQSEQSYFRSLPFIPGELTCFAVPEILAEKIRVCYQRNKARDIWDLGVFVTRPLDHALIRCLVVLKLWQAGDTFDPARLMQKFADGRDFDWDNLRDLLRRTIIVDRDRITAYCVRGFAFLADLTNDEHLLANDHYHREQAAADRVRGETWDVDH